MVKKVKNQPKEEKPQNKSDLKEQEEVKEITEAQAPQDPEESLTVQEKKANAKKLLKAIKKTDAKIKSSIDKKQVIKAIEALQSYQKGQKSQNITKKLLEDEDSFVQVNFTLTQVPVKPTPRPQQINIPHPFNSKENNTRVCLFVKDPAREIKNQLAELKIPCIAKVIGYDKLKKNYRQFKEKRKLLQEYDQFLADIRVYKMLPERLGREFYDKKKYPCPIKIHGHAEPKELQKTLNKAAQATYFIQGNGPNYSVKIGRTSQDSKNLADNFEAALSHAIAYVTYHEDIKFSKISSVSIKVGESPELPVFNQLTQTEVLAFLNQ